MPRLLDLFSGRWGWSKAFAARGWQCVGIDLIQPPEIPAHCLFFLRDVFTLSGSEIRHNEFDFICASSPCEQFSVHGMKHFHPNPPYPALGIKLFEHTRRICEESGVPYVMENVRAAQQFVGNAVHHCGPFYLWGTGVPPLMAKGIQKGVRLGKSGFTGEAQKEWRRKHDPTWNSSKSKARQDATAHIATIPPELANCVADYAERLIEVRL
jgi:C-5 cytosine-specific DNA methylase